MNTNDDFGDAAPPTLGMTPVPAPVSPFPQPVIPSALDDAGVVVGGVYDRPPELPARSSSRNWMGIVSLVTGVVTMVVPSLIFGVFGLAAYRKGQATTRAFAIAGIATSVGWLLILGLGAVALAVFGEDTIPPSAAQPGDCFKSNTAELEDFAEGSYTFELCTGETNGIVYFITALPSTAVYPTAETSQSLFEACTTEAALADVDQEMAADYYVEYLVGPSDAWATGDHSVICGLSTSGTLDYAVVPGLEPHYADS